MQPNFKYEEEDFISEDEAYVSGSSERAVSPSTGTDNESEGQDEGHELPDPTMRDCGKLPSGATTRPGWVRPLSPPSSHPGTKDQSNSVAHCPVTEPLEGVFVDTTSSSAQQGTVMQRKDAKCKAVTIVSGI